jgi:predicted permease
MGALRRAGARLLRFMRPGQGEDDLSREIAAHLALLEDEHIRQGLSPEAARRAARLALGSVEVTKERHREARSIPWLEDARRDVRHAVRRLSVDRGLAVTVVLTIGIAIGAATAIFSVVDAVLLQPLPYREPDRLAVLWEGDDVTRRPQSAPVNYWLLADHDEAFASLAALAELGTTLDTGGDPEKIVGRRVTAGFFDVLGVRPEVGRAFTAADDVPGAPRVVILSHELWRSRFGADPAMVGRDLRLDGERVQVVGIMPARFQFLGPKVELWVPMAMTTAERARGSNYLTIVGRLKIGVSIDLARRSIEALRSRLGPTLPATAEGFRLTPVLLHEDLAREARRPLVLMLGGIAAVLLIGCANVAGLLLARAGVREPEMALRGSLGATRGRLLRQLVAESLVLCGLGLAAGLGIARLALAVLAQLVPPTMVRFAAPSLDGRAFAVAAVAALGCGLLFGVAPALHLAARGLGRGLAGGARVVAGAGPRRGALVIAEVALTLVLLVVAGLLVQTVYHLRYANVGYEPSHVVSLRMVLPMERYPRHEQRTAFYDTVLDRVGRLPGVTAAAFTTGVPLAWKGATTGVDIEGHVPPPGVEWDANFRLVSGGYHEAIGTPLRRGRYLAATDRVDAPPVVVVNEAMAGQFWPGLDPVGRRLRISDNGDSEWLTVVGIVGDVRQMGLDLPVASELYLPYPQYPGQPWFAPRELVVRAPDPLALVASITREIHAVDASLAVSDVRLLDDLLDEEVAARRLGTVVLASFAGFAALLVVVGIYGVVSYYVVQHTPEIGVRVALGAEARDIVRLVAGRGVLLAAVGVVVGGVGALAAARFVRSLLYGVGDGDPMTFIAAAAALVVVSLAASYVPARRAARLDPVAALRR